LNSLLDQQPLTLLYLAHLRWDHVWQRPQQLMSRLAARCRVIYVDPPEVTGTLRSQLQEQPNSTGVRVLHPVFPESLIATDTRTYEQLWLDLLPAVLAQAGPNSILWVSSPLADYLVEAAKSQVRLVVYDCMDDLVSFSDGTQEMLRQEDHLLQLANLLFTGGYSMYEARKNRHPRAYCFPSGVDAAHYRQTEDPATQEPAALATIPHPRLGYFGVLDERIDWALIAEVAARRPDWQWVLVGPTAKIDPGALPVAPNIHYLGQQQYADLPAFLKGFDVATMPFALNAATRFISPTKTLEYLAGGKPVVSSSVPDVAALYKDVVYLADGPDAWVREVTRVLTAPREEWLARRARAGAILEENSWDNIAARMWGLIAERLPAQSRRALASANPRV
jgi:glycosyltransferase involved in cell wall biosynthesis